MLQPLPLHQRCLQPSHIHITTHRPLSGARDCSANCRQQVRQTRRAHPLFRAKDCSAPTECANQQQGKQDMQEGDQSRNYQHISHILYLRAGTLVPGHNLLLSLSLLTHNPFHLETLTHCQKAAKCMQPRCPTAYIANVALDWGLLEGSRAAYYDT